MAPEGETKKDSSSSRRANKLVSRLLTLDADLEYSLQDGRYWMPYRQVLSGRVTIPLAGDFVIPFEAVTSFRDYEINTGRQPVFSMPLPDSSLSRDSVKALHEGAAGHAQPRAPPGRRARQPLGTGLLARSGKADATRSIVRPPIRSRCTMGGATA